MKTKRLTSSEAEVLMRGETFSSLRRKIARAVRRGDADEVDKLADMLRLTGRGHAVVMEQFQRAVPEMTTAEFNAMTRTD